MVTVSLEGSRPLLVEVQSLTSHCSIGLPRRRTTGVDFNRLSMLLAVLERRAGLGALAQQDVFVSSLGGVRIIEPACDLAITLAIASSLKEKNCSPFSVAIGEVGLTGEVRPAVNLLQRIQEAKRVGFKKCLVSARSSCSQDGIEIIKVRNVREAISAAIG
jgi:DNA repair protein RadA/Sms